MKRSEGSGWARSKGTVMARLILVGNDGDIEEREHPVMPSVFLVPVETATPVVFTGSPEDLPVGQNRIFKLFRRNAKTKVGIYVEE